MASETRRIVELIVSIVFGPFCLYLTVAAIRDIFNPEESLSLMIGLTIFFGVASALCIFFFIDSLKRKRMLKDFRKYVGLISVSHNGSFSLISSETGDSVATVQRKIEWMVDKNFFNNARINLIDDCIDIPGITEVKDHIIREATYAACTCKFCGATSKIQVGRVTPCPYCSSPLQK